MPSEAKHPKTLEARAAEAQHLTSQLRGVGLPDEVTQPVVADMTEFVRTGQGVTRTVHVPAPPLAIQYVLSNQAHVTSRIRITRRR